MKTISLLLTLFFFGVNSQSQVSKLNQEKSPFALPSLPYSETALEPIIDAATMQIHHARHHKAYVDNLNKALQPNDQTTLIEILKNISQKPDVIRNNAGGHWNHSFFWTILTPDKNSQKIPKRFENEIKKTFGSFDNFKSEFEKKGLSLFGSGWVWLIRDNNKKLVITTTVNQDNPLMDVVSTQGSPVLALDVWEHAYYLQYQNKRTDYIKNFWNVVNWKQVNDYDLELK